MKGQQQHGIGAGNLIVLLVVAKFVGVHNDLLGRALVGTTGQSARQRYPGAESGAHLDVLPFESVRLILCICLVFILARLPLAV